MGVRCVIVYIMTDETYVHVCGGSGVSVHTYIGVGVYVYVVCTTMSIPQLSVCAASLTYVYVGCVVCRV